MGWYHRWDQSRRYVRAGGAQIFSLWSGPPFSPERYTGSGTMHVTSEPLSRVAYQIQRNHIGTPYTIMPSQTSRTSSRIPSRTDTLRVTRIYPASLVVLRTCPGTPNLGSRSTPFFFFFFFEGKACAVTRLEAQHAMQQVQHGICQETSLSGGTHSTPTGG